LPTGHLLRAARIMAGLKAGELAGMAGIDASTLSRMERSGRGKVRGQAPKVDAVITVLKKHGVEIIEDYGVQLTKKPRR
jgi:transcriptional regulator with XRE-family HTH domain